MSENKTQKPPPGVTPRFIWIRSRSEELAAAVSDHVNNGYIGGEYLDRLKQWSRELFDILDELNNGQEKGKK